MVSSGVVYMKVLETTKYVKFKVNFQGRMKKKRVIRLEYNSKLLGICTFNLGMSEIACILFSFHVPCIIIALPCGLGHSTVFLKLLMDIVMISLLLF